jgi:general secretion pathway protein M
MTLADRPALGRIAALSILALLVAVFCLGPLAGYCGLIADNGGALAARTALLQRYRALAAARPGAAVVPEPVLLYPDMPEAQASALLQESVKSIAAAAHIQVQGLQVLRGDAVPGATRIGVRVRASGDIASLRNLIYAVETARPLLYPDNLQIQSHAAASDTTAAPLDFQLDISGFKPEASKPETGS